MPIAETIKQIQQGTKTGRTNTGVVNEFKNEVVQLLSKRLHSVEAAVVPSPVLHLQYNF